MGRSLMKVCNFNPTLVRFKPQRNQHVFAMMKNFNPTLVRFKRSAVHMNIEHENRFQSYISAI